METVKFKTNIKCDACVAKVTPGLNESVGEGNWNVDLQDPERTLSIRGDIEEAELIHVLGTAGYRAEKVK
jgi:copper chaperone